ncbi:Signature domain protein [compost metagenome]
MRLPPIDNRPTEWSAPVVESWAHLVERANRMKARVGNSDAFDRMRATFREMASSGRFERLKELLARRLGARALTWLWLHDEVMGSRLFNVRMLDALVEFQQPRLSRLTLLQLIQLYFGRFDRLDERNKQADISLRERLEFHLLEQLQRMPERRQSFGPDPLHTLKREGQWLLALDGPNTLVRQVREQGGELGQAFESLGLTGYDTGRFGDICRAHFYLETLRELSPGEWDPVLDELLKPSVSKAPYEGERRIGHVALEIMIDRAGDDPGDAWQNFILSLAGDPRIASSTPRFREWWKPLGEDRIGKVRGWLSKEDLRLFLQAVEQYGVESGKEDLQRMFPARKLFLEGLFKLGLIRHTRLMLGRSAQLTVKRILGGEVKTNFATMESTMNDKAVIYLDCGDFHLVEGSHSFKIWVYLGQPGHGVKSYERNSFSHYDLTTELPRQYKQAYPKLPYEAVTHNGSWQRKVFDFLADNGIALDIEKLLSRTEYKSYLSRFGMPVVRRNKLHVEPLTQPIAKPDPAARPATTASVGNRRDVGETRPTTAKAPPVAQSGPLEKGVTDKQLIVLKYLDAHPESSMGDIFRALEGDGLHLYEIQDFLRGELSAYVQQDAVFRWSLKGRRVESPDLVSSIAPQKPAANVQPSLQADLQRLGTFELRVLWYFVDNPGDKVRYAANVLDVDAREINRVLYGPLKAWCKQGDEFGWTVRPDVVSALDGLKTDK